MRFQRDSSPPPYLNRADQYRLLALCVMLLVIALAIREAANPQTWAWLLPGDEPAELAPVEDLEDISFLVKEGRGQRNLAPDEFIAVQSDDVAVPEEATGEPRTEPATSRIEVDGDLLKNVDDNHLGWRRGDLVALQAILERVRETPLDDLVRAQGEEASFRVINTEPELYRGRLLHLRGVLHRLEVFPQEGVTDPAKTVYAGWMVTEDSGNHPWMVLCTELPPGLPPSQSMEVPVTVSAYFFKRFGYGTQDGATLAPLLIGKQFHLLPTVKQDRQRTESITYYVLAVLAAICLMFGLMLYFFMRSDRKFSKSHLAELAKSSHDPQPVDLELLKRLETVDPGEAFKDFKAPENDGDQQS